MTNQERPSGPNADLRDSTMPIELRMSMEAERPYSPALRPDRNFTLPPQPPALPNIDDPVEWLAPPALGRASYCLRPAPSAPTDGRGAQLEFDFDFPGPAADGPGAEARSSKRGGAK
jgi:hypothetical protein